MTRQLLEWSSALDIGLSDWCCILKVHIFKLNNSYKTIKGKGVIMLQRQIHSYIMTRTTYIPWDDEDFSALDQQDLMDLYSAPAQCQQLSAGRHVAPFEHICGIPS
jgi:hypothetical protein